MKFEIEVQPVEAARAQDESVVKLSSLAKDCLEVFRGMVGHGGSMLYADVVDACMSANPMCKKISVQNAIKIALWIVEGENGVTLFNREWSPIARGTKSARIYRAVFVHAVVETAEEMKAEEKRAEKREKVK